MSNMQIVAYSDEKFTTKVAHGAYEVMLNPEKLQWDSSIKNNDEAAVDSSAPATKHNRPTIEKLSFDLVIDCTGAVDSGRLNLPAEIAQLSKVIYGYNGEIHRPNYVIINWGRGLAFKCVLASFNLSYTFFKPDGTPLRAKVSLEFISYIDLATLARRERKLAPGLVLTVPPLIARGVKNG